MKYLSICSGIEASSVAWEPLELTPVAFSEIEAFPCSVLRYRFPDVPNLGDMNDFMEWPIDPGSIDILAGGTPCQSFSIAGLRGGLTDARGNLALTYCRILDRFKPRWFVWENVPGVLSSAGGRDFGSILGAMVELGYGVAYRVLDAQFFGVPQRRRRVFVVGCLGNWRRAAEVLFESGCLQGDSKTSRKSRKDVAGSLASRTSAGGGLGTDFDLDGGLQVYQCQGSNDGSMGTLRTGNGNTAGGVPFIASTLTSGSSSPRSHGKKNGTDRETLIPVTSTGNIAHCLNAGGMGRQDYETETMVAYRTAGDGAVYETGNKTASLTTGTDPSSNIINRVPGVRRLTPLECERLQGFPHNWTLVPHRGKPAADGPRFKAIGNSMAVPCMRWIGARIKQVNQEIE